MFEVGALSTSDMEKPYTAYIARPKQTNAVHAHNVLLDSFWEVNTLGVGGFGADCAGTYGKSVCWPQCGQVVISPAEDAGYSMWPRQWSQVVLKNAASLIIFWK
jgi:hypothetical protein